MINTSNRLIIVCKDADLRSLIIEAASKTERDIFDLWGVKNVTVEQAIEENARGHLRYPFIQYFKDIKDNRALDTPKSAKEWLNRLFCLIDTENANTQVKQLPLFFTEKSRAYPQQKAKLQKCLTQLHLFIHNLWCVKLALLPPSYSRYPTERVLDDAATEKQGKRIYRNVPLAEKSSPEFLKLARSKVSQVEYNEEINILLPENAIGNINWYAHRFVRAQDVWELKDLTKEHINNYLLLDDEKELGFQRSTSWLSAIVQVFSEELDFDVSIFDAKQNPVLFAQQRRANLIEENPNSWLTKDEAKLNPENKSWIELIEKYKNELVLAGFTGSAKLPNILRQTILAPLLTEKEPFPKVNAYSRKHWLLSTSTCQLKYKQNSWDDVVRKCNAFFDWLSIEVDGFKNPISKKIDIGKARRNKGTTKELLPEGAYPVLLSYNYAIAEFLQYVNFNTTAKILKDIVIYCHNKDIIYPSEWGFTPIFYVKGKPRPISEIATVILSPLVVTTKANLSSGLTSCTLLPNYTHLTSVLMETGIRAIHLRWLDETTFNRPTLCKNPLYPNGYGINKLHVNTDKSHGAWDAVVSDTVIDTLEKQLKFKKKFLKGDNKPSWYNDVKNSPFGKITPLFATANSSRTYCKSFPTSDDNSLRRYWKRIIKAISYELMKSEETQHLVIVENPDNLELSAYLQKDRTKIIYTPHGCRSQVVSNNICTLPPELIKEMTGHVDNAHIIYYAQVQDSHIERHETSSAEQFIDEIKAAIIDVQSDNSSLKRALQKEDLGIALTEFAALSFDYMNGTNTKLSGIERIRELNKKKNFHKYGISTVLYFDTTHICPFNNQCPEDITKNIKGYKPCGQCPYAIKTIDHIPAITSKIRKKTDDLNELQFIIDECKRRKERVSNYTDIIDDKKELVNEITAWSTTCQLLSSMSKEIRKRDKWLTEKPEFLKKHLSQFKANNELAITLVKVADAETSATFMTPTLKAQASKLRKQLLISTKRFKEILDEPEGYELLSNLKGIVSSVCTISGLSTDELGEEIKKLGTDSKPLLSLK